MMMDTPMNRTNPPTPRQLRWGIAFERPHAALGPWTNRWLLPLLAGLLFSLISGDGLALKPSGLIGSIVGAVVITAIWRYVAHKKQAEARAAAKASARSGRHH